MLEIVITNLKTFEQLKKGPITWNVPAKSLDPGAVGDKVRVSYKAMGNLAVDAVIAGISQDGSVRKLTIVIAGSK